VKAVRYRVHSVSNVLELETSLEVGNCEKRGKEKGTNSRGKG
jgi:hypothetical protein